MSDYPDLSQPLDNSAEYPDLSQPLNQSTSLTQSSNSNDLSQYMPEPRLPFGMNIISGLVGSLMPKQQGNLVSQLPQVATGTEFGTPQRMAGGIGSMIPSFVAGGTKLLPQTMVSGVQGAAEAEPGQEVQGAIKNMLATLGVGKLLPGVVNVMRAPQPEDVAKLIQQTHDTLKNNTVSGFQAVTKGVNDRGISQIPVYKFIMDDIRDAAKKYLPRTSRVNSLLQDAHSGDFNSLRDLQTELWQQGTNRAKSSLPSDRNEAEEIFELRDKVNDIISNHLQNTGNFDLDKILNESRLGYRNLQETFFNKKLNRAIPNLVDEETRKIPNNLMKILQEDSVPMNNLKNNLLTSGGFVSKQGQSLNIPSLLNAYNARQNVFKNLTKLGLGGAGALGAYHYLVPEQFKIESILPENQ